MANTIEPNLIGSPGGGMSPSKMKKYTERIERAVESLSPDQQGALQLAGQVEDNKTKLAALGSKQHPVQTKEEGFFVTDHYGNVILSINDGIFDVFKLSQHICELIKSIGGINNDNHFADVQEDGWHIIDALKNDIVRYDKDGFDVAKVSQHFIDIIAQSGISADFIKETEEKGFFFVDKNKNIAVAIDSDGMKTAGGLNSETDSKIMRIDVKSNLLVVHQDTNVIDGLTKSKNSVKCSISVKSKEVNFAEDGTIAYQGNTSLSVDSIVKKGFTLAFDNTHRFSDWIEMDEYNCKGYFSDWIHVRDLMANWLIEQIYNTKEPSLSRPYKPFNDYPSKSTAVLVDGGAKCHIDGIPCELYLNGEYWGLYSLNIKKERKNYLLNKSNKNHIQVEAAENMTYTTVGLDWSKLEVRNPKGMVDMQGVKYDGENPRELIDETSSVYDSTNKDHTNSAFVKSSWKSFISKLSAVSASTTKEQLAEFMNLDAWIDYIVISWFISHWDNWCKNTLYTTWDALHWSPLLYDMDNSFGITEITGDEEDPVSYDTFGYKAYTYCPWLRTIESILADDIKNRYAEYRRNGIFSTENINKLLRDWTTQVGKDVYDRDTARWAYPSLGNSPKNFIDSAERRVNWVKGRIAWLDNKYNYNV